MAKVIPFKDPDWVLSIRKDIKEIHEMQAVLKRELPIAIAEKRRGDVSRIHKDQRNLEEHLKFRLTMLKSYERGL